MASSLTRVEPADLRKTQTGRRRNLGTFATRAAAEPKRADDSAPPAARIRPGYLTFVTLPSAIIVHGPLSTDASAWSVKRLIKQLPICWGPEGPAYPSEYECDRRRAR